LPAGPEPSARFLSLEERVVIADMRLAGCSMRKIAAELGRSPSTVSREIARNAHVGDRGYPSDRAYRPYAADLKARARRARPRVGKIAGCARLRAAVQAMLDDRLSPEQIAARLRRDHPEDPEYRVSHETIYQALYVQTRGSLRQDLHQQLSTKRPRRKPHPGGRRANSPYREAFTISQRPAEAAARAVPGHWEGDLVMGTAGGVAVGTLVERTTRFTILLHLPGRHDAEAVAEAMIREMSDLPEHLRRSLTWDRGTELARYDKIQLDLDLPVYFCDPHSPWQRGTNENTNRLLRHWLTKGTDLARFSAADLRRIAASLNARPRPTLDMRTPAQALDALLATPSAA
jgi:IS30 family transposase